MTKKMLPSPAQIRVLEAMADGAWLSLRDGSGKWCLNGTDPIGHATVQALYHAGRVMWISEPRFHYEITNLGRHALEAARASKGAE